MVRLQMVVGLDYKYSSNQEQANPCGIANIGQLRAIRCRKREMLRLYSRSISLFLWEKTA